MRVLISSTGGVGHFGPLLPFIAGLRRRGDEVLVVVPPAAAGKAERTGAELRVGGMPPADELADLWDRFGRAGAGEAAVIANREIFGRLGTAAMLPVIDQACREWRPDVVVHEPAEFAGAIAADRHGLAHVQVAISLAEVEAGSLGLAAPVLEPYAAGVVSRIRASLYLSRFPAAIDPSPYPVTRRYHEQGAMPRPLPDWWLGSPASLIYVTFGTVTGGVAGTSGLYRSAVAAVADLDVRVLVTTGPGGGTDLGPLPSNVHAQEWVDQPDAMGRAAAVVCHGGSGTVLGALSAGVPMVIVAMFADQPVNARRVVEAGAGLLVEQPPGSAIQRATLDDNAISRLRSAVQEVLADDRYRRAARLIADEVTSTPTIEDLLPGLGV